MGGGYGSGGNPASDQATREFAMGQQPATRPNKFGEKGVAFKTDMSQVGTGRGGRIFGAGGPQNQVEEERRLIDKVFSICDKDNSGSIDMKELEELLKLCGVNTEFVVTAITRIMANVDKDFDGMISPQEFHAILSQKFEEGDSREDILGVFKKIAKKDEHHIDGEELKEIAAYMGEELSVEECEDMIKTFSIDYQSQMASWLGQSRGAGRSKDNEPKPPKRMTEDDFIKVMHTRLGGAAQGEEQAQMA